METTDAAATRIPHPVTGSIDDGGPLPPTRSMLVGRYLMIAWLPAYAAASALLGLTPPLWLLWLALATMVVISRIATGSWWRSAKPGAWWIAHLGLGAVAGAGWIVGIVTDSVLIALAPAVAALCAIAGAAAMHAWLSLRTPAAGG